MTPQIDTTLEKLQQIGVLIDQGVVGFEDIKVDTNRLLVQQVGEKSGLHLLTEEVVNLSKKATITLKINPESIHIEWH